MEKERFLGWVRDDYEKKYIMLEVVVVNLSGKVGIRLAREKTKDSTINLWENENIWGESGYFKDWPGMKWHELRDETKKNPAQKAEALELETQEEAELLLLADHTKPKQLMESLYDHLGWLTSDVSWQRKFTLLHLALARNVSDKARDSSGHYGSKTWVEYEARGRAAKVISETRTREGRLKHPSHFSSSKLGLRVDMCTLH